MDLYYRIKKKDLIQYPAVLVLIAIWFKSKKGGIGPPFF